MRFLVALLLLVAPGGLYGWESYKTDITQQTVSANSDGLDHLEPVDRKIPESAYLIEFIREPTAGHQSIHLTLFQDDKSGKFYVSTNDVSGAAGKVEIPEDMASSVYSMWVNALLEVRYDRLGHSGKNGPTDLFSAYIKGRGWLHGAASNPTKDLPPKWMEDSATALVQFTKDKDEAACRRSLTDLRDKLFAYLGTNGKN